MLIWWLLDVVAVVVVVGNVPVVTQYQQFQNNSNRQDGQWTITLAMKSPNSINVYELQFKIDEKLHELQKRKNRLNALNSGGKFKERNKKLMHLIKMTTITREMQRKRGENSEFRKVRHVMGNKELLDIINRIMVVQKSLIKLSRDVGNYRRLQMSFIFFQCSLSIVFNAYNLVVFLLKLANNAGNVPLSWEMLFLFYGYHILNSLSDIIVSVMAYHGVFEMIRKTATIVDELNMYILDGQLNARITQLSTYVYNNLRTFSLYGLYNVDGSLITSIISGTATYIIILIQYSGDGEICQNAENSNLNKSRNHS